MPARVVITEYVEVAHGFYGDDEPGLVNARARRARPRGARQTSSSKGTRPERKRAARRDSAGFGPARASTAGLLSISADAMTTTNSWPDDTPARPSEDELIARYFAPIAGEGGLGLDDDAALLTPTPGHDLVAHGDAVVAGVHFFPDDPPGSIARKALGVNISDLAAKGASPVGFLLTLALPEDWTEAWLAAFAEGLGEAARDFACPLLGGDTVRAPGALTLSITALGEVPAGRMVRRTRRAAGRPALRDRHDRRCGARPRSAPGARGALGSGARLGRERAFLLDRYLHPQPRIALAGVLREHASRRHGRLGRACRRPRQDDARERRRGGRRC